jgi:peroxiredoxin Q/BCP
MIFPPVSFSLSIGGDGFLASLLRGFADLLTRGRLSLLARCGGKCAQQPLEIRGVAVRALGGHDVVAHQGFELVTAGAAAEVVERHAANVSCFSQESQRMSLIDPGKKAPAFTLNDQHGKTHKLSDYAGKPVVLYFYPKDDTPGCTKESCQFQDNLPKFKSSKAVIFGVSILDEKSKKKFADKFSLTFSLLADADHAIAEKYGVWQEKSLYGRKFMGIARTTYLIGADGKIAQRWDNVKVDGHADEVLAAVKAL